MRRSTSRTYIPSLVFVAHCFLPFLLILLLVPIASAGEEPVIPLPETCYAEGTPLSLVELNESRRAWRYLTSLQARDSRYQFDDSDRWSRTATDGCCLEQGDPTTITWSIVPDGTSVHGYNGEPAAASNLQARLNEIYGSKANWLPLFHEVFDRWGELTGITYVYEPDDDGAAMTSNSLPGGQLGVRGDVRIAGHRIDGNGGVLAYNFFPNLGDMVIDSDDSVYDNTSNDSRILKNVLAHEHGHGLGLSHVCPLERTKLMEPFLATAFDGPQHDDILAANRGYGDNAEDNDAPGSAASLSASPTTLENLSIDDNSDIDYFSFTVGTNGNVSVTVTPVGETYLSGPQTSSCSSGSTVNTLDDQDLEIEILDQDGTTVIATADNQGAGVAEALSNVALSSGAGTYYAAIRGGSNNLPQMYELELSTDSSGPTNYTLSVSKDGTGAGSVTSDPSGLVCGSQCSAQYPESTTVTLVATPGSGSTFSGWSGSSDCVDGEVTLESNVSCTATFDEDVAETARLSVNHAGSGSGSVTSNPSGISCGSDCSQDYPLGTEVTLTATPDSGSTFAGWSGIADCADGVVELSADVTCTASFEEETTSQATLTVRKTGTGRARIVSDPNGIGCGSTCSAVFDVGTEISLEVRPRGNTRFHGFTEAACQTGIVSLERDTVCTAVLEDLGPGNGVFTSSFEGGSTDDWSDVVGE